MSSFCRIGTSRKLLRHEAAKSAAREDLPFEDIDQKSSPADVHHLRQADQLSLKDEPTFAMDSSWEEDDAVDAVVNYTLVSELAVSEAAATETVAATGQEAVVVDAAADIAKFPSKNDL